MKAAMITQQARSQLREMPIKLPLFFSRSKPPKNFASTTVVGLGIVAAMGNSMEHPNTLTSAAVPARSSPIPISPPTSKWKEIQMEEEEMMEEEFNENYTYVISRVGKDYVRKRVYYRDEDDNVDMVMDMDMDTDTNRRRSRDESSLFQHSSPATPVATVRFDFLKHCFHCEKNLEGIDIFMYRGEKAFCSTDCRHHQITADEYHEKMVSKSHKPFDCSASPCSAPMFRAAGVAAA